MSQRKIHECKSEEDTVNEVFILKQEVNGILVKFVYDYILCFPDHSIFMIASFLMNTVEIFSRILIKQGL